jgi:hypothetical protein
MMDSFSHQVLEADGMDSFNCRAGFLKGVPLRDYEDLKIQKPQLS